MADPDNDARDDINVAAVVDDPMEQDKDDENKDVSKEADDSQEINASEQEHVKEQGDDDAAKKDDKGSSSDSGSSADGVDLMEQDKVREDETKEAEGSQETSAPEQVDPGNDDDGNDVAAASTVHDDELMEQDTDNDAAAAVDNDELMEQDKDNDNEDGTKEADDSQETNGPEQVDLGNDDENVAAASADDVDEPMEQDTDNDKENETKEAGDSQGTNASEQGNVKDQGDGAAKKDDDNDSRSDSGSSDDDSSSDEEDSDDEEDEPSSQNVASASAAMVTTEDGHTLSAYELQRLERIRRNKEYLESLGLEKNKPTKKPAAKKPPARRKPQDIKRRSSISRASKEKKVTYSERKDKEEEGGKKKEKEPWNKRPKENRSARMERFIHDEFRRIGKEQRHHLKRAKKNVRAADVEYRIAKQRADRYGKKRSKELEYQQSMEQLRAEQRALGGKTARMMCQEVESRWYELAMAIRSFDERFNPDWAKQQEENSRKIEILDAMDRFPKLLKEAHRSLDVLLIERSPRDPQVRRGTRKRKSLDSTDADEEEQEPDTKMRALESPNGAKARVTAGRWGSLASAIAAETLSSSTRTQSEKPSPGALAEDESDSKPAAKQKPKKKKREVVPMNVGGWVSPAFSQTIDRSWLEADRAPKKFDPSSYIPQVGDTVLYYPAGHKEFLKINPDVLGKQTRKITRMTLWDRAKKEKTKLENAAGDEKSENGASKNSGNKPSNKWWNDEWLSLIDGDLERYPIICRVEKTHAEFPPDPFAEDKIVTKDDASGGVQVAWAMKKKGGQAVTKKKLTSSSLRLAVMLRPLTSVMPPQKEENLTLAPNFYVVTFPSKAAPFLVPFSWAYRLSHSLTDGSSIRLSSKPEWRAKVKSFNSLEGDHGSSRFDDKMDSVRDLYSALKSGPKSFGASLEEALSWNSRASIPLTDACTVIERFESALEKSGAAATASSKSTGAGETTSMMRLIRSTLPLWKEVEVASGSGRTLTLSAWELTSTDTKISVPTGPLVSISADIEAETGLVYSIDESLRAKIECTIEDYLKDTPDAAMFCPLVKDSEAASYSTAVPRGMAFNKVLQRLRTGKKADQSRCYYRSVDSLLGDIAAIADNCVLYNSPDSVVVETILEIVPSIKRLIVQVASQHFKEKEAMEKSAEERRQAIELQCNAPALLNDEGQQSESTSRSRGNSKRPGLQPPYTEFLHRSWIQAAEPDGSWSNPQLQTASNEEHPSTVKGSGKSGWLPQSGDSILYSRSLHTEFVKGHHPSLTTEQCEVPVFSGESDIAKQSESQDDAPSSGKPLSDDLQNRWLVGKIMWVRAAFPRAPSKRDSDYENTFEVASPVLDLGIRFNYSWASNKVYTVSWRPCTFAKEEAIDSKSVPAATSPGRKRSKRRGDDTESDDLANPAEESTKPAACEKCNSCQLTSDTSFVRPAWIPLDPAGDDEQESSTPYLMPDGPFSIDNLFACPKGLTKELIGSIDRCLNVLKRRCLDGVPANHVDPKFNTENVKKGWSPPAPKIGKSLPTFDRLLDKGNAGSGDASTRGVEKVDKRAVKLLADATFLPQWTLTLSEGSKKKTNRDGITQSLALHETLSPTPSFCLELIQTRLRNGYYRNTNSLAHDIQEAYFTIVLLLLAKPAMAKMGQAVSIRRTAKALSATKDVVSFANADSKKAAKTIEKVVAASKQGEKKAAKSSALSESEQEWVDKIFQIRKLYGTALACAMQPVCMEKIFGSVPKKQTTAAAKESIGGERQQTFMKARNTLGYIYHALQRDPCDNRPSMSWSPPVKVKIRFTGQEAPLESSEEDTSNVDTTRPIVIPASDYESNEALVKFFFGRPGRMGLCGHCSANGRSTMMCRVRKNHSRPDFDWISVFKGTGGLDGLLYTLRTGRKPPEATIPDNAAESQPVASLPSDNAAVANAAVAATAADDGQKEPDPFELLEKAVGAVSLADEVLEKAQKFSEAPVRLSEEFVDAAFPVDPEDGHYNYCILCGLIGDVICCEGCPNVVHPRCVNLGAIPDEDWFCSRCKRQGKDSRSSEEKLTEGDASTDSQNISAEEKKEDAKIPESQDSSDPPGAEAMDGEKTDGDTNSESQKPSASVAGDSQEPSAASANEEEKKGEEGSESQKPSEALAASVGADVLPESRAAPFGLDDEADRLEVILGELKSARPIKPKKPKQESTETKQEQNEAEGSGDDEEDEKPSSPAGKARSSRSTRSSATKADEGADGGDSSEEEEEHYGARPQPKRIRVGMKVKKYFGKEHGYYYGKVLEVPSSDNPFYLVRYEDDDEEDLTEEELRECILGSSAERPNGRRRSSRKSDGGDEEDDDDDDDQEPPEPAKRRGRPSRARASIASDEAEETVTSAAVKKRRGRPSRTRDSAAAEDEDKDDEKPAEPVKRRGRPSRARASIVPDGEEEAATSPAVKKRRGRPSRTRASASAVAEAESEGEQVTHAHATRSAGKKRGGSSIEAADTRTSKRKRVSKAEDSPPKKRGRGRPRKRA